ncbi:MAG: hypothetical protein L3J39_15650 [Verrucomicrobiales bacterium]|nr:hypothetical protein [Verrucomicrobiales bacterium]
MISRSCLFLLLLTLCLFSTSTPSFAQNKPVSEKSAKYLKALEKRPFSDLLFERFFESWLEDHSIEQGFAYLDTQSKKSPAAQILLARLYQRQGQLDQAASAYQTFAQSPDNPANLKNLAWLEHARISHLKRDYSAALKSITLALESQNNSDPKTTIELSKWHGRLLLKTGKTPAGLKVWQQLLAKHPKDDLLREDVIALLLKEGVYDQAVIEQQALIATADAKRDVHHSVLRKIELGKIYLKARRRKEALALWQSTLPLAGNDTWLERELIALIEQDFRRSNNLSGWQTALDSMIASEPKRLALHIARAKILTERQQKDAALVAWKQLLELTPGDLDTRLLYVHALITLDQLEPAITQLSSLCEQFPNDEELLFQLADLQDQAGQKAAAGKSIAAYLKQSDGSEYAHLRAAKKLQRFELISDAQQLYEKMVARFPDSISAQDSFARFLYQHDQKKRALQLWQSIGQSGGLQQLLAATRQLRHRSEWQTAYDLMQQRLDAFDQQTLFLDSISQLALELDHQQQALTWSLRRLELSSGNDELQQAIAWTLRTATQGKLLKTLAEKLQKETPSTIAKTCLLAATQERLGDVNSAIDTLSKLPQAEQLNELILITLSQIHSRQQNWAAAASTLERLIATPAGHKPSHISDLILLYQKSKNLEKALHWTREWKKLVNASPAPWLREANLLAQLDRHTQSLKVLQSAARRFEENDQIQVKLAHAYTQAGYPKEAEHVLWKLYESTDDDWKRRSTIKGIVEIAQKNKTSQQIIERLKEQQNNNSQSVSPLLSLAEAYRLLHQIPQQRDALDAAHRLDPNNIQLLHQIATAAQIDGRITDAIASLKKARKLDSKSRSSVKLAQLYMSLGRAQDALDLLDNLPAGNQSSPERLIELAQVTMALGEWEVAARFLTSKMNDHPDHIPLLYLRAVALLESEQPKAAQQALLELLSLEMIPNSNKPTLTFLSHAYRQQMRSNISTSPLQKPLKKFETLASAYQQAGAYRNNFGQGRIFSLRLANSPYQQALPIALPSDTFTLRGMTLYHLHRLQNHLLTAAQADLVDEKIARSGLPAFYAAFMKFSAPFIFQAHSHNDPAFLKKIKTFLLKHQDQAEAALIWIQLLDQKHLYDEKSAAIFLGSIQQHYGAQAHALALIKLKNMGFTDDYAAQLSDSLDVIKEPGYHLIAAASNQLVRLAKAPADEHSKKLRGSLLKLLKKTPASSSLNPQIYALRAQAYTAADDLDAWIELLQSERKKGSSLTQKTPAPQPNPLNSSAIHGQTRFGSPPAEHLLRAPNGFSPALAAYLIHLNLQSHALTKKPETWIKHFAKDPILYALLARSSNHPPLTAVALENLKKIPAQETNNVLNASLLIALHQIENQQTTQAVRSLEHLVKNSNKPELNKKIDFLLVQLANDDNKSSDPAKPNALRKSGIAAALRLRVSPLVDSRYEWQQIARILVAWKMADKAQRPAKLLANHLAIYQRNTFGQHTQVPAQLSSMPSFKTFTTQFNRIQKNNPSPDALVRLTAHQLPIFASGLLNFQGENSKRQIQSIRQQLEQKKLIPQVLDLARPEENAPLLQHARFAAMNDALGQSSVALQLYTQLLEEFPKHQALRLRQFQLLAESEPDKARSQLRLLAQDKDILPHLVTALQALARLPYKSMKKRLDVAEWLLTTFDQLSKVDANSPIAIADPFADPGEYRWSTQLAQSLNQAHRDGEINYPTLTDQGRDPFNYDPFSKEKKNLPKKPEHLLLYISSNHKRIDLLRQLLIKQIETGTQSEQAFASLVRLNAQTQKPDSELLPYCQKALLHKSNIYRLLGNAQHPNKELNQGKLRWKNPDNPVPQYSAQTPLLWIIEYAFHHQQPELLEIPRLFADSPATEAASQAQFVIKTLSPLYFCPDEQFTQLADHLLDKKVMTSNANNPAAVQINKNIINAVILRALALRPAVEKNFPWQDFIIARLGEQANAYTYQKWTTLYCRALAQSQGHDSLVKFIEKIALRLIGDPKQQKELISTYLRINLLGRRSSDPSQQRLQYFVGLLASLTAFPETGFYALETAHHYGLQNKQSFIQSAKISRGMQVNDSASLLALFDNPYLTRDLANYDTFPKSEYPKLFTAKSKSSSIVSETLARVKRHWQSKKGELDLLKKKTLSAQTFGEKLLSANLAKDTQVQTLLVFHNSIKGIKQLPAKKQYEIALLASDLINLTEPNHFSDNELRTTAIWLQQQSGNSPLVEIEKIIAAKSISDLNIKPNQFLEHIANTIIMAVPYDLNKAYSAFENAAIIGESLVQKKTIRLDKTPFSQRLFGRITYRIPFSSAYFFAHQAFTSEKLPPIFSLMGMNGTLKQEFKMKLNADKLILLSAHLSKIKVLLKTEHLSALAIPVFSDILDSQSSAFREALLEWTQNNTQYSEFAKDIQIALIAKQKDDRTLDEALSKRLHSALQPPKTPVNLRLILTYWLYYYHVKTSNNDRALDISTETLAQAWDLYGNNVPQRFANSILYKHFRYHSGPPMEIPPETINHLSAAFRSAFLEENNHNIRTNQTKQISQFIDSIFKLQIASDNIKDAELLLETFQDKLHSHGDIFVILVKAGAFELAQKFLRQHWKMILLKQSNQRFDKKMGDQFEPFLASISTEPKWLQWVARSVFLQLFDSTSEYIPKAVGWPEENTRRLEAAKTLNAADFPDTNSLRRAIQSVQHIQFAGQYLGDALSKASHSQTLKKIIAIKDSKKRYIEEEIFYSALRINLENGKLGRWHQVLLELNDLPSQRVRKDHVARLSSTALNHAAQRPKESAPALNLMPIWIELVKYGPDMNKEQLYRFLSYPVARALKSKSTKELDTFFSAAPPQTLDVFSSILNRSASTLESQIRYLAFGVSLSSSSKDFSKHFKPGFSKFAQPSLSQALSSSFTKISSAKDIAPKRKDFIRKIVTKMNTASSTQEIRSIFDHACKLIDQEVMAGNREWMDNDDNGWLYPSVFFREYCKKASIYHPNDYIKLSSDSKSHYSSKRATNWHPVALLCDTLWNDPPPNFSFTWSNIYRLDEFFAHHWEISQHGELPELALDLFFPELRKALPADQKNWGDTSVFLPIFYETFRAIRDPQQVVAAIQLADKLADKEVLAREFAMAGRLWLTTYPHLPEAAKNLANPDAWIARANEALDSKTLSPNLRACLARHFLYRAANNCPKKLQQRIIEEITELVMHDAPLNGWELSVVNNALLSMPRDKPWWKNAVKNYIAAWNHKSRFDGLEKPEKIPFQPKLGPVLTMLSLQLESGHTKEAKQLIKLHEPALQTSTSAISLMILHQQHDLALRWTENNINKLKSLSNRTVGGASAIYYTEKLDQQLDGFLPTIKNQEQRILLAAMITAAPLDPRSRQSQQKQLRKKRVTNLAKEFLAMPKGTSKNTKKIIQYISHHCQGGDALEPLLAKQFQSSSIEEISSLPSKIELLHPVIQPLASYASAQALRGNTEPLKELMRRIATTSSKGNKWHYKIEVEQIAASLFRSIVLELRTMNPQQIKWAKEASQIYFETLLGDVVYNQLIYLSHTHIVLTALVTGKPAPANWNPEMSEQGQEHFKKISRSKYVTPASNILDQLLPSDHSKFKLAKQALENQVWLTPKD